MARGRVFVLSIAILRLVQDSKQQLWTSSERERDRLSEKVTLISHRRGECAATPGWSLSTR